MATTKTDLILNDPDDWLKWNEEFKTKAIAIDLWDYIKEDPKALLVEPSMPEPETFKVARLPA